MRIKLFIIAFLLSFSWPSNAQLVDYRSLDRNYFGSNTVSGVKGIVTGMIGTNAADGSITNRNSSRALISQGGTAAGLIINLSNNLPLLFGQTNGVSVLEANRFGDLTIIKSMNYNWPTARGGAGATLVDINNAGQLIWTNFISGTATNIVVRSGTNIVVVTNGPGDWTINAGTNSDSFWRTNPPTGGITNVNSSFGKVEVAGTNAVITADNKTSNNLLLVGQANSTNYIVVYTNGGITIGNQTAVDNHWGSYAGQFGETLVSIRDTELGDANDNQMDWGTYGPNNLRGEINSLTKTNHADIQLYSSENTVTNRRNLLIQTHKDDTEFRIFTGNPEIDRANLTMFLPDQLPSVTGPTYLFNTQHYMTNTTTTSPLVVFRNYSTNKFLITTDAKIYWGANATLGYSPPPAYGSETNYVLTDTNGSGGLSWQPGLLSPTGTNIIRSIATNAVSSASIGPGTNNYVAQFVNPTNVQNSLIKTLSSNLVQVFLDPAGTSRTNSGTNEWYGEFTNAGTNQWLQLVVPKGHNNESAHLRSMAIGQTSQRAPITINDTLVVEPPTNQFIGHGSVGFVYPASDDTIPLGSGASSWHGVYSDNFGFVAQPASAGPQFGTGSTGTGMGITTDGTMIQFFRDTGWTASFNKERVMGTLQLDLAGNLLGFGSGVSNTAAFLVYGGTVGYLQLGTNNTIGTSASNVVFAGAQGSGTDKGGAPTIIGSGRPTGIGTAPSLFLATSGPGITGTVLQGLTNRVEISGTNGTVTIYSNLVVNGSITGGSVSASSVSGSLSNSILELRDTPGAIYLSSYGTNKLTTFGTNAADQTTISNGTVTAVTFSGALSGNATTATSATTATTATYATTAGYVTNSPLTNAVNVSAGTVGAGFNNGGAGNGDVPVVVYRTSTARSVSSSSAQSNVVQFAVPANSLGTNKSLVVEMNGSYLQNTGSSTNITIIFTYGATTNFFVANPVPASVNPRAWWIRCTLRNVDATNAQELDGEMLTKEAGAATVGNGAWNFASALSGSGGFYGTSAEDSTAAKNFTFLVQLQSAASSATIFWTCKSVTAIIQ